LRAEPRDARDLMIAGTNGWIVALDNLSRLPVWLSDAICRLATGGGFSTRELYTDAEEMLFDAQRLTMLNGIEELATRGDLLDRAIVVYLPGIPEDARRPEAEVWRDLERAQLLILGALLDAVRAALARIATVKLARLPRMADFALWVAAATDALDWNTDGFLQAYAGNRQQAIELALDAALMVTPLRDLLAARDSAWQGTASELLHALEEQAPERLRKAPGWPTNGRALSNALRRVAPNLRQTGVDITFQAGRRQGRIITIEQVGIFASSSSSSSSNPKNQPLTENTREDETPGEDAKEDAKRRRLTPYKHKQEDDEDAKMQTYSKKEICAGCNTPFAPGQGRATGVLCATCAAETKRRG
jgi:hypothetical protein